MADPQYDVIAIGNAIVDVLAPVTHQFLKDEDLPAGSMRLIDAERSIDLYAKMGPTKEISGGAAANTLTGATMLGLKTAFVGQVADDQLGEIYRHDLTSVGVDFDTPASPYGESDDQPPTGRCLILVDPDGDRTMNTSLGASMRMFLSELGRIAPSNSNVDGRGYFRSGACRLTARRLAWSKSTACSWTRLC